RLLRGCNVRAGGAPLLATDAPAARLVRAASAEAARRAAAALGLRGDPRVSSARGAARGRLRADARGAGAAGARDLERREGRRRRTVAARLLRDGPAAVSCVARAVHDQRDRRARVVL